METCQSEPDPNYTEKIPTVYERNSFQSSNDRVLHRQYQVALINLWSSTTLLGQTVSQELHNLETTNGPDIICSHRVVFH